MTSTTTLSVSDLIATLHPNRHPEFETNGVYRHRITREFATFNGDFLVGEDGRLFDPFTAVWQLWDDSDV